MTALLERGGDQKERLRVVRAVRMADGWDCGEERGRLKMEKKKMVAERNKNETKQTGVLVGGSD